MSLVLWIAILQLAGPTAVSEPLGDNRHRITLTFATDDREAGARRLDDEAARLCGALHPHFERYQFEASERVDGLVIEGPGSVVWRQEVACRDQPPAPPPAAVEVGPVDTAALQPAIDALTRRYFSALDAGDYTAAHALTSPLIGTTAAEWTTSQQQTRREVGVRTGERGFHTTWYVDHPDAPPGVFAAVDHGAQHQQARVCGYVGWFRPAGETEFRITTLNTTIIQNGVDPNLRAAMEAAGRCVDPPPETVA